MTLGSLFDGSGGFPLAGQLNGITPVWASEVEPFPIKVTRKHFPQMKHLGDIHVIDGAKIQPVDIITFGSPCQDMSVAKGKRDGLAGSRSNLFFEAIRVIKEMRNATHGEYPRFIVWENVQGAFTSNKGEDFRHVLEAICRVADENVSILRPDKWSSAGEIMGDGYSVAWRLLDAQYWGVPQRRRRIYLVADFRGKSAPKVLFKSASLPRDIEQGGAPWQRTSGGVESGFDSAICIENHGIDARYKLCGGLVPTLSARFGTGGNNAHLVMCYGLSAKNSNSWKSSNPKSGIAEGAGWREDASYTLNTADRHTVAYGLDRASYNQGKNAKYDFTVEEELQPSITARGAGAVYTTKSLIRRLTPLECCRLQGFPDDWCKELEYIPDDVELTFWRGVFQTYVEMNGQKKRRGDKQIIKWLSNPHTDSAEYKMWGNGIALPCAAFVLSGIAKEV